MIPIHNAYVVTGTLTDEHTVTLDEALPLAPTRVRVVVEPVPSEAVALSRRRMVFGQFAGERMSTEEDFRIAEWRGESEEQDGN